MSNTSGPRREGSLEAPTRHTIDWRSPQFTDAAALDKELERVFDICHGCRRCFSLCNSFPTLFDAVDATSGGEVSEVPKTAYWQVVEHCYLCDMCYMTKCPYVPPHEWNVDFPHLMLRAKVKSFEDGKPSARDKLLSSTDLVGTLAGIPVVAEAVNAVNATSTGRGLLEKVLGVDREAPVPKYHSRSARKRLKDKVGARVEPRPAGDTTGKVAVFATCYGNRNHPGLVEDLVAVLEHNGIGTVLVGSERCCGMPKLELGDLESIEKLKDANIDELDTRRLSADGRGALVRAHVQTGVAAAVPGGRAGAAGREGVLRSVRLPHAPPSRGRAEDGVLGNARQGQLPGAVPPSRAEHRPQDA
jgi:hypothetical protein